MQVRSPSSCFGAAVPDMAAAVYQHNQTDLEFLVAAPLGFVFDSVKFGPSHVPDGREAGTELTTKGSVVNINLLSPAGHMDVKWEGPDLDACVKARS